MTWAIDAILAAVLVGLVWLGAKRGLMKSLAETGSYTVRPETLAAIQENFSCGWSSEEEVAGEIRVRYEKDNYLCDTHTLSLIHI